jgi:hypothetical protein
MVIDMVVIAKQNVIKKGRRSEEQVEKLEKLEKLEGVKKVIENLNKKFTFLHFFLFKTPITL